MDFRRSFFITVLRVIKPLRKGRFVTAMRRPAAPRAVFGSEAEPLAAQFTSDLRSQGARSVSAVSSQPQSGLPYFSSDNPGGLWPRVFK
jgi:hypothetical protein